MGKEFLKPIIKKFAFRSNPDLVKKMDKEKALRGRELTSPEEYNLLRNDLLGKADCSITFVNPDGSNITGDDAWLLNKQEQYIKDVNGNYLKFRTTWTPKATPEGEILPKGKGSYQLVDFLTEELKKKPQEKQETKPETELEKFLNEQRTFYTGQSLTEGEKRIKEEEFYLEKLGYSLKRDKNWLKGIGRAIFKDQEAVRIVNKADGKEIKKDEKSLGLFKINWVNRIPSKELMDFLRKEYLSQSK